MSFPNDLPQRVLYQDADLLVLNKPAGVPVHKGYGGGDTLDQHFHALQGDADQPPALAHRLDRDTAGCLVLGRTPESLKYLGRVFSQQRAQKTYWAIVYGAPAETSGKIDLPLTQKQNATNWRVVVDTTHGQAAHTRWRLLGAGGGYSWLECEPLTGRTHQIRVHCAALGYPLVGDHLYGSAVRGRDPLLHLHARAIRFKTMRGEKLDVSAPPPEHMLAALKACGWDEDAHG